MTRIRQNGGFVGKINNTTTSGASGIFGPNELQYRRLGGLWPNVTATAAAQIPDEYFEYTTLLIPGNGTNGAQNNTFLDGSTNNFTITRIGNTTQGTFSPFSQTGWGNYFDGTGDYLSVTNPSTNIREWWTTDYTIEAWVFPLDNVNLQNLNNDPTMCGNCDVPGNDYWSFGPINNGVVRFKYYNGSAVRVDSTQTITINQWNHVAMVKTSSGITIFVNGVSSSTTAISGTPQSSVSVPFTIGANYNKTINAYVSNLRIVKGTAVYTGNFTPPTAPLTAISGTSLLTCQSNRFIDNSSNNFTITRNGDTRVVAFSPFNPTASWSAATNGGSGYFDGSGDWLSAPANTAFDLGTSDFTIEGWFYYSENPPATYDYLWAIGGNNTNGIALYVDNKVPKIWNGSNVLTTTGSVPGFAWTHIAAVRSSGTLVVYQNGTSIGSVSFTSNLTGGATAGPKLGKWDGVDVQEYVGYVNGFRIIKGTAVYTGNFTPPSLAPLTTAGSTSAASYPSTTNVNTSFASSATSLLLNFTNAGISDATSKNDLETVGNAQISTAISAKWGSGSMSFDGTGDYLIPNISTSDLYTFGTGAFTVEFWLYLNSTSGVQICIDFRPLATNGPQIILFTNSGVLTFQASSTVRITGSTLSTGQWYHIALARSGTDTKLFLNGTQTGSTYSSDTTSYTVGANRPAIGADGANLSLNNLNGYLQDVRITKGIARYTANFTAPTAAFPTL